jgi:hypothetical protein
MEPYDQHIRRLISEERIEQLARDCRRAPGDRRRRGRFVLRGLSGAEAHRRAQNAQLSRS